jgi:hypothetical protein
MDKQIRAAEARWRRAEQDTPPSQTSPPEFAKQRATPVSRGEAALPSAETAEADERQAQLRAIASDLLYWKGGLKVLRRPSLPSGEACSSGRSRPRSRRCRQRTPGCAQSLPSRMVKLCYHGPLPLGPGKLPYRPRESAHLLKRAARLGRPHNVCPCDVAPARAILSITRTGDPGEGDPSSWRLAETSGVSSVEICKPCVTGSKRPSHRFQAERRWQDLITHCRGQRGASAIFLAIRIAHPRNGGVIGHGNGPRRYPLPIAMDCRCWISLDFLVPAARVPAHRPDKDVISSHNDPDGGAMGSGTCPWLSRFDAYFLRLCESIACIRIKVFGHGGAHGFPSFLCLGNASKACASLPVPNRLHRDAALSMPPSLPEVWLRFE